MRNIKNMFNAAKRKINNSALITVLVSFLAALILLFATKFSVIELIAGPEKISVSQEEATAENGSLEHVDISMYEGKYVTADISYVLSLYEKHTIGNEDGRIVETGFIVYTDNTDYFGIVAPSSYEDDLTSIMKNTSIYYSDDSVNNAPESICISGTVTKMSSESLKNFNANMGPLLELFGMDDYDEMYYIDVDTVNNISKTTILYASAATLIFIIIGIYMCLKIFMNMYLKGFKSYLAKHSEETLDSLSDDFEHAAGFGSSLWISSSHIYAIKDGNVKVLKLDEQKDFALNINSITSKDAGNKKIRIKFSKKFYDDIKSFLENNNPELLDAPQNK